METADVIAEAVAAGVGLEAEGDDVRWRGWASHELLDRLRACKGEALALLREEPWRGDPAEGACLDEGAVPPAAEEPARPPSSAPSAAPEPEAVGRADPTMPCPACGWTVFHRRHPNEPWRCASCRPPDARATAQWRVTPDGPMQRALEGRVPRGHQEEHEPAEGELVFDDDAFTEMRRDLATAAQDLLEAGVRRGKVKRELGLTWSEVDRLRRGR